MEHRQNLYLQENLLHKAKLVLKSRLRIRNLTMVEECIDSETYSAEAFKSFGPTPPPPPSWAPNTLSARYFYI